jgi:hypothetical protein
MSGSKISELTPLSANELTNTDEFVVVDKETNTTKKLSYGSFSNQLNLNSVLRYGADPTGVADSTTAFTNCLAENAVAFVPSGLFKLSNLTLDSKSIMGTGTLTRAAGSPHTITMLGDNPRIEGVTFDTAQSAVNGESDIKLGDSCQFPEVEKCKFRSTLYSAISADTNGVDDTSLTYAAPANGFVFQNNKVEGSYSRHLYLHNVESMRIVNNSFKGSKRDSIRLRQATRKVLISGNIFDDIGEEWPDIIERPRNWSSLESFTLGQEVSVPPFGIFRCIVANSTIGANPATLGAAEWTNIAQGYFETKDVVDGFHSTIEFIFTNNIINKCASYGLDLKGAEPQGLYVSQKMIITNNLFQNCFIGGINLFFGSFLNDLSFKYVSQISISNNIFTGNNRERFDVSESPIKVRGGVRGVSITNNIIEKNYARALNIANFDGAGINKDFIITGNHIYSNGLAGNLSAVGINAGAVDGMIIKNNVIKNLDKVEEYKVVVSGTATAGGTINFPARGNAGGSVSYSYDNGDTAADVVAGLYQDLLSNSAYIVTYDTTPNSRYYANLREDLGTQAFAVEVTGQLRFTSKLAGESGNGYTVIIDEQGTAVPLYPAAGNFIYDAGTKTLTIETRSTTKPFHLIASFNSNASAEIKSLFTVALEGATSSDVNSQVVLVDDTEVTAGGVSANQIFFDARLERQLTPTVLIQDGLTITLTRDPLASNSVQYRAMNLSDWNQVGATLFRPPRLSYIISDNYVSGNGSDDRFSILYNNVEPPALFAYVDSTNTNSTTIITTQARTHFIGGADSGASTTINAQAYLIFQGITLRARLTGAQGNKIALVIDQQIDPDQPLRVIVAPAYLGGKEIWIRLPTDSLGDPVDVTVSELEDFLKQRLGQCILSFENNYLALLRPAKEGILGPENLTLHTGAISSDLEVTAFRGTGNQRALGASIISIEGDITTIENDIIALEDRAVDPVVGFDIVEHWVSGAAAGQNNWVSTANSGVVGMNISLSTGKEIGIVRLDTSTSATSAPTINLGASMWIFSSQLNYRMSFWLNVGTLSTGTEEYSDRSGFLNSTTSAAPTHGAYFEYDRANYGANWQFVTTAASTVTRTDTGVAAIALFRLFEIEVTANTEVKAYIAGALVATHTTNIPSGTGQSICPTFQKIKSVGTTARITYIDWTRIKMRIA